MRDSHRLRQRFEISLDNRQLLGLTMTSLVVMGGIFIVGVMAGKKLTMDQIDARPADDLLSQVDERSAALESMKDEPAPLTFQDELTKKAVAVAVAPEPAPVQVVAPVPVAPPAPEPAPIAATNLAEVPKSQPVATRIHEGSELKDAFGKAQTPESLGTGAWTLQLASSQDKKDADRFVSGLRAKGYTPYVLEAKITGRGTWYRVRVGQFETREAAQRYLSDFKRETTLNGMVISAK